MSIQENWFEHSIIIDQDGVLLDDYHNELRDEEGGVVYIPKEEWINCIIIKREEF